MKFVYESKQQIEFKFRSIRSAEMIMHRAIELYYLKTGAITAEVDGIQYGMHAGDLIVIFPDTMHAYFNSAEDKGYLFIMPSENLKPYRGIFAAKQPICPLIKKQALENSSLPALFEILRKDYGGVEEAYKTALSQAIVGKALGLLEYRNVQTRIDGYDGKIEEALKFINTHYTENPSRKTIARAVGLNESYVSRMFSEKLHCTLLDYIHTLKLQDAAELLINTKLSVAEIALQTGFSSVRSFTRNFAGKYGMSPREYRKCNTWGKM